MELAVAIVVAVVLFVFWAVAMESKRHGSFRGQEQVTDIDAIPPLLPDDPISGFRQHRSGRETGSTRPTDSAVTPKCCRRRPLPKRRKQRSAVVPYR